MAGHLIDLAYRAQVWIAACPDSRLSVRSPAAGLLQLLFQPGGAGRRAVAFFPENPPFVGKAAVFHGEGFIIRFQRADFLTKTFRFPLRIRRLLLQSGKLLLYFFFRTLEQRLFFRRFHTLFSSFHRRFGQTETLLL